MVADFLIHVVDASNPQHENHIKVVNSVLGDIGATGKPEILVYNKTDLLATDADILPKENSIGISVLKNTGINELLMLIGEVAPGKKKEIAVLVPYSEGALVSRLHETQKILSEEYTENGTKISLLADSETYESLKGYMIETS